MTPEEVLSSVARFRTFSVRTMRGVSRRAYVTRARHEAMWLLREVLGLSFPAIAQMLGRYDHTTVLYACRKIESEMAMNPAYRNILLSLVQPVRRERLACASVSCSGCIPDYRVAA